MLSNYFNETSRCEELIIVIRDQSGSMHGFNKSLDEACLSMMSRYSAPDSKYSLHFVAFAGLCCMADGPNIAQLRHITGQTYIPQAFERAVEVAKRKQPISMFKKVVLVFISDGQDNDMVRCMAEINRLRPMPCPCRFISVGFSGFPTGLASGKLFEVFGQGNQVCDPPVLPCDSPEEVPGVFEDLFRLIENPDPSPPPAVSSVEEAVTTEDLLRVASRSYNACMVQSLYTKTVPEIEAFSACKAVLGCVRVRLALLVRDLKKDRAGPSLLTQAMSCATKPTLLRQAQAATASVQGMQSRISDCLDKASRKELVALLDDETQRRLVGFAAREGKLATKAIRYHSPDAKRIHKSFLDFIDSYPDTDQGLDLDTATRAPAAGGHSLYEVIADAKRILHVLRDPQTFSPLDMVEKMPQFGIPLRVAPLTEGAVMNCWLVQVDEVGLGGLVTVQAVRAEPELCEDHCSDSEAELCASYFSEPEDSDGLPPAPALSAPKDLLPNCLALVPSELPGPDTSYLRFTASVLLYKEPLYHNEALKSIYAATVVALLQRLPTDPDASRGLAIVHTSYRRAYPRDTFFEKYVDRMADDLKFRECLVAEHPSLEGFLTCPHLTKPVFAMWLLAADGRALAADQLQLRLRGFLIELFHRAGVGFAWAPADYVRPIDEVVDSLVDSLGVKAVLSDPLSMGTTRVQASAKAIPSLMEPFSFVALPPETIMHLPRLDLDGVRDFRHYQFTYQAALDVFRGLGVASSCPEFAAENTVLDLARQLQVAKTSNNIERNSAVYYATPMTEAVFEFEGYKKGFAAFKPKAVLRVGCKFSEAYINANLKAHSGPVTRLDPSLVREWSAQHGFDAEAALDLDAKGLSRTACLCATCPHYLRVLGPSNRPGKVSPALKAHLEGVPTVPGLHKAIYERFPRQEGEELDAYVGRVSDLLRSGCHLEMKYPEEEKLRERAAHRGRACWPPQRLSAEYIVERIMQYSEGLKRKIHCGFGKPGELEQAVRSVLSMPVLDRAETFEALCRAFPAAC